MKFELKPLSSSAVPKALVRAERYRFLNQPELAESICQDILAVEPQNQEVLKALLLAVTDQFSRRLGDRLTRAKKLIPQFEAEYDRLYYSGLILERQARSRLRLDLPGSTVGVYELLREAMEWYEKAEAVHPSGNEDARLRWNACARTIMEHSLEPARDDSFRPLLE